MKFCIRIFALFCLLSLAKQAHASHIVGGEFELVHLQGNRYRLNLILYSDDINIMDPAAIDPTATVHLWQKSNNLRIRSITLPKVSHTHIPYTNPDCTIPQLSTSKVVYSAEITLESEIFNDQGGYYINYERCCRNGVINNIQEPGETGQAFYLEFPAVVKNGAPFVNSSPSLFPPLSDFARLGYPFYFDFSGSDADGDSLVYSLATPLAGSSSPDAGNIIPEARPAPYNRVEWAPGYSQENMIPGTPPLSISNEGLIRITPSQTGLFVFSVLVEEFREGIKIGEVRRDFQMLVYDYQGSDEPPLLQAQKVEGGPFYTDVLHIGDADFSDYENNRCFSLQVSDKDVDAENAPNNGRENLRFKVRPLNFSGDPTTEYLSVSQGSVDKEQRSITLDLCLPLCPPVGSGPYLFDVIAYDDACAVPLSDTLRVVVDLNNGSLNHAPDVRTSLSNSNADEINVIRELGQTIQFTVSSSDPDGNPLSLRAVGAGFSLEEYGMVFTPRQGNGPLQSQFSWKPGCSNVNLPAKNMFKVFFISEDSDLCQDDMADTVAVNIGIKPPPNDAPALEITGLESYEIETLLDPDTLLVFNLRGYDPNTGDILSLRLDSVAGNPPGLQYSWEDVQASGGEVTSALSLQPDCGIFENGETERSMLFYFSVQDDPCFTAKTETLSLQVKLIEKTITFNQTLFPNVFTPNGDGINDFFTIKELPDDACYSRFENVQVINRWGKVLYQTFDRSFQWDGGDYPAGTYFYQVNYTGVQHRSTLTLIRNDAGQPGAN